MLLRITETIFHSQYFWFYCFGAMILLYIIAAIYNRKKHPKQGIKSIKVKVDSINQARVQLETRTNGLLWTPTPGVPGARFDVAFLDEEHNETICLKVNEQECEKLKVGESGILQYNGDEYISFLQGQEAEAV